MNCYLNYNLHLKNLEKMARQSVEEIKEESRGLYGKIAETLLLKNHILTSQNINF